MSKSGQVLAVCTSTRKGVPKTPVGEGRLLENHGLEGDAHAGTGRQVSLLCDSSARKVREQGLQVGPGDFAENLLVSGLNAEDFGVGTRIRIYGRGGPPTGLSASERSALLEVTQIGKECHADCAIRRQTGDCVMPREGIFAKVLKGGPVRADDVLEIVDDD